MDEIQQPDDGQTEQVAQPTLEAEKSDPWDLLMAKLDAIETRLSQLESVAHSGHELDGNAISHIATVAVERINESIRARFKRA